jgi:hypothetical protein
MSLRAILVIAREIRTVELSKDGRGPGRQPGAEGAAREVFAGWVLSGGVVASHGASVVSRQRTAPWVDCGGRDEPGVSVEAHDDAPAVVVDLTRSAWRWPG